MSNYRTDFCRLDPRERERERHDEVPNGIDASDRMAASAYIALSSVTRHNLMRCRHVTAVGEGPPQLSSGLRDEKCAPCRCRKKREGSKNQPLRRHVGAPPLTWNYACHDASSPSNESGSDEYSVHARSTPRPGDPIWKLADTDNGADILGAPLSSHYVCHLSKPHTLSTAAAAGAWHHDDELSTATTSTGGDWRSSSVMDPSSTVTSSQSPPGVQVPADRTQTWRVEGFSPAPLVLIALACLFFGVLFLQPQPLMSTSILAPRYAASNAMIAAGLYSQKVSQSYPHVQPTRGDGHSWTPVSPGNVAAVEMQLAAQTERHLPWGVPKNMDENFSERFVGGKCSNTFTAAIGDFEPCCCCNMSKMGFLEDKFCMDREDQAINYADTDGRMSGGDGKYQDSTTQSTETRSSLHTYGHDRRSTPAGVVTAAALVAALAFSAMT